MWNWQVTAAVRKWQARRLSLGFAKWQELISTTLHARTACITAALFRRNGRTRTVKEFYTS